MPAISNATNSISQRRKAICKGLSQYLTGDDLLNAMCIWQQEYSHLPKFAITNFVRRVTEHTEYAKERAAIHLSLTSSLMLSENNLGPDPLPEMRSYLGKRVGAAEAEAILGRNNTNASASGPQTDSAVAFELLLGGFLQKIANSNSSAEKQVRLALLHKVTGMNIEPESQAALMSWLQRENRHIDVSPAPVQMQEILHESYVATCQQLGPVKTDQLLTEALTVVETSEAGRRFSPREFL